MTRKKHLWIPLTLMLLASIAMVNVPVKGQDTVKIYVVPAPPAYIPGVDPGGFVYVDVYIESPAEWYDTTNGIVGWAMSIKTNPDVLEPWSINGSTAGFFLYDYTDNEYGELTTLLLTKDGPNGLFYEVSEFIDGWESDPFNGKGAGGNAKLCTLRYKSHSLWYSLIDLGYPASPDIDTVYYYTSAGKFAADIIGDGQYSEPPTYEANMVRRSAWPEHHHFVRSKDGWANVTDSHGTPGNLTLYARIRNDGNINVTVRAEFNLTFGLAEYPLNPIVSDEAEIEIGQIIDLTATFQGLDGEFPWEVDDDGKWRVEAFCSYYDANTETWEIGTRKTKTFGIAVVA